MSERPLPEPPAHYQRFVKSHPEIADAYEQLGAAVRDAGPLSDREVALVKLALSIGACMEGATHAHVRKAHSAGLERAALEQTVLLAIPTLGFPRTMAAYTWVTEALAKLGG